MSSPFMVRESELRRGQVSRPRTRAGAVRWQGRRAPFAGLGEVIGKVLSLVPGAWPLVVPKGGAVYSVMRRCQPGATKTGATRTPSNRRDGDCTRDGKSSGNGRCRGVGTLRAGSAGVVEGAEEVADGGPVAGVEVEVRL